MTDHPDTPDAAPEDEATRRAKLPEAAQRALAEADARRAAEAAIEMPRELGGRKRPRTHPLWRLGKKRHCHRFLTRRVTSAHGPA